MPSAKSKRAQSKRNYQLNRANILSARKKAYAVKTEELKSEARASYPANPNGKAASKARYSFDPEKKKAASRASWKSYSIDPERRVPLVLARKGAIALTQKERRVPLKHAIALTQKKRKLPLVLALKEAIALTQKEIKLPLKHAIS